MKQILILTAVTLLSLSANAQIGSRSIFGGNSISKIENKKTTADLDLIALSATNDSCRRIKYKLYHSDTAGAVLNVVTAIMKNDIVLESVASDSLKVNEILTLKFYVTSFGEYKILSWGFDNLGRFIVSDTLSVCVIDMTQIANVLPDKNNLKGKIYLRDISGKLVKTFDDYLFEEKINFSSIPFGIYIKEFISNNGSFREVTKVGFFASE